MDGKNGMLLWVLGGAGVLLMYSAYKNQHPQDILAAHLGTGPTVPAPPRDVGPLEPVTGTVARSSYSVGAGAGGLNYVYDSTGTPTGVVPAPYQDRPRSWIPPKGSPVYV